MNFIKKLSKISGVPEVKTAGTFRYRPFSLFFIMIPQAVSPASEALCCPFFTGASR